MNFFEHQQRARRSSSRLVVLFALAVLGIVLAVDAGVWLVSRSPHMVLMASLATVAIIGIGSFYRIASLGDGGDAVAQQLGGTLVAADTVDPTLRRLRNVVEEIAIASGVPVPTLYVLEEEPGINAFAAGFSPTDAVVAVTRGTLERLNRDELQGVIAHEFSHILNGDMRLNLRLVGVLFGILMIGLIGRKILAGARFSTGRNRGIAGIFVAALVAMAIGYVGMLFARMIKAGISRSRERLADASAVQFTRQTAGLAGALKKIAGIEEGSRLEARGDAEEVSHMLFGDGLGFSGLFATHPPLLERIQALEPSFRNTQLESLKAGWRAAPPDGMAEDLALGLADGGGARLPREQRDLVISPPQVAAQVARPGQDDYREATTIVGSMPDALRDLARDRDAVMPLLLALLIDAGEAIAEKQRVDIAARLGDAAATRAMDIHQQLTADLHPALRLPLAALAFPVLRLRPRPQLQTFIDTVQAVANSDGRISLFEYCLARMLSAQVIDSLEPGRRTPVGRRKPGSVRAEFSTLLAVVARYGNEDDSAARRAYLAGLQRVLPRDHVPYAPPVAGVQALDAVWEPLDALDPLAKQAVVEAVTAAISSDGLVSVAEAELLRTICAVLHCPLPPMLGQ